MQIENTAWFDSLGCPHSATVPGSLWKYFTKESDWPLLYATQTDGLLDPNGEAGRLDPEFYNLLKLN